MNDLSAHLEALLVRELAASWHQLNAAYFRSGLRAPTLRFTRDTSVLGRWIAASRTLEIARELVLDRPWGAVLEVLKHEMAHQYVSEVLRVADESPHGSAFRDTCQRMGIDAAARGVPEAGPSDAEARALERVARLLALAESPNVNEAEAAMAAAQKLMLRYNLTAAASARTRSYAHRHLGQPSGRVGEAERILAMILGKHFFVECIWVSVYRPRVGKRGSVLEVCGTRENLDIAEYVHSYLLTTGERLWTLHKQARKIRGDRDRRTFLAGVMAGFESKLSSQKKTHESLGLVWIGDRDLGEYYRRRNPYVRHVRYSGGQKNEAYGHGREQGTRIVLRKGVGSGDEPTARGRLLGTGSGRSGQTS
jgi:hypothetical protein